MFNKLTCKVRFHIAVWSLWVNAIIASSLIENVSQISAKPIVFQRNLLGKLSRNRPFFTYHFSATLASKIPTKFPRNQQESAFFPANLSMKIPQNLTFFPRPTRSPAWYHELSKPRVCVICLTISLQLRQITQISVLIIHDIMLNLIQ